jgi:methionyl-tRNA synthetase
LKFYEDNPKFIIPQTRMNDIVQQVRSGLEDLSVSRPVERLTWGVRVPTDTSQTMYVWLDALLNYATAVGFPFSPGSEYDGGWPADIHVVGKDIIRFHCIYWPAFLMALDVPLPKQVLTHAHWTLGRQKMAKSTGNVVNPFWALERFGMDPMRWYLVHEGGITDDADYDNQFIIDKYKKGLKGGLGNLASRIMRYKGWDVRRAVEQFAQPSLDRVSELQATSSSQELGQAARNMAEGLRALPEQADKYMQDLHPNRALQTIMNAVYDANAYLQQTSPWNLVKKGAFGRDKSTEAEVQRIVYLNAETLRLVGIMLQPFIPTSAKRLLDMLGVREERRNWYWCVVGRDNAYGVPLVEIEAGEKGVLFPGLTSGS